MAKFLGVIFAILCIGALCAWGFQWLWNYFIPFFKLALPLLSFWQAWGILIMIGFIRGIFK